MAEARTAGATYQIAILDRKVPGMDGEELATIIKRDPVVGDTRSI